MSDTQIQDIKETVLAEREKGNVVFWVLPGQLAIMSLEDILCQPVDGLLYDLNRIEEVVLTFIDDPKWINDFAVAQVIRKLVDRHTASQSALAGMCQVVRDREAELEGVKGALDTIEAGRTAKFPGAPDAMTSNSLQFGCAMWTWSQKVARAALHPAEEQKEKP